MALEPGTGAESGASASEHFIELEQYRNIILTVPTLCVDLVIRSSTGKFLLAKRKNQPLQGLFWTIGGRVHRGETVEVAARRKAREELGIELQKLDLIGIYEDFYDRNTLGMEAPYHTLSVVFETVVDEASPIRLDQQHSAWTYADGLPERFVIRPFWGMVAPGRIE